MKQNHNNTYILALCSLLSALGAVFMLTGCLIPIMTYCAPMMASVLLIPVQEEYGKRWAWMVWAVTAILTMMLCTDKEAAFFYLFFGYYPIIKNKLDLLRLRPARILIKMLFFGISIGVMYLLIIFVFGLEAGDSLRTAGLVLSVAFCAAMVIVMLIFDMALRNLTRYYQLRIREKLKFLQNDKTK